MISESLTERCTILTFGREIDGKIPKTIGVRAKKIANIITDEMFIREGIAEVPVRHKMIPHIFWAHGEWGRRNSKQIECIPLATQGRVRNDFGLAVGMAVLIVGRRHDGEAAAMNSRAHPYIP